MKSQHWTNFVPTSSKVDNYKGGTYPPMSYQVYRHEQAFTAVTYRLAVAEAQNGWHHTLGMYSDMGGVKYSNAVLKRACRPGFYQMVVHFNQPWKYDGDGVSTNANSNSFVSTNVFHAWYGGSYSAGGWKNTNSAGDHGITGSLSYDGGSGYVNPNDNLPRVDEVSTSPFYHQAMQASYSTTYSLSGETNTQSTGVGNNTFYYDKLPDLMILRPSLVDPNNCDNHLQLWSTTGYVDNRGWQMYYTGFPVTNPALLDGTLYEI